MLAGMESGSGDEPRGGERPERAGRPRGGAGSGAGRGAGAGRFDGGRKPVRPSARRGRGTPSPSPSPRGRGDDRAGRAGFDAGPPRPRMRRGRSAPPAIARAGDEAPLEIEVRVPPGQEEAAERELRALGAEVEVRGRGELRATPRGPVRPVLELERPLAFYAVRPLPDLGLDRADAPEAIAAALEL